MLSILDKNFSRWHFIIFFCENRFWHFIQLSLLSTLGKNFNRQHFKMFSEKTGLDISCILSPLEMESLTTWPTRHFLTFMLLNNLISHIHFCQSANQITSYNVFIQIYKLNGKQCRSWSDGFFRSHLIWIYNVCKGRGCREQQDKG